MIRALGLSAVVFATGLFLSLLISLSEFDWRMCFDAALLRPSGDPTSPFTNDHWQAFLWGVFTDPFTNGLMVFVLYFGPTVLFAVLIYRAQSPVARKRLLIGLLLFGLWCAWMLLPPSTHHDCDRKGSDAVFLLFLILPAGFFAALIVNKINCFLGARDHDPNQSS